MLFSAGTKDDYQFKFWVTPSCAWGILPAVGTVSCSWRCSEVQNMFKPGDLSLTHIPDPSRIIEAQEAIIEMNERRMQNPMDSMITMILGFTKNLCATSTEGKHLPG